MEYDLVSATLDQAVAIQQIPAPTFAEGQRAAYVSSQFAAIGLENVFSDEAGNVYGCLPGVGLRPAMVVSAHLDTVFPMNTDLTVQRRPDRIGGPGIGDNSLGVAGLLGLAKSLLEEQRLPGDVWLVANVGEEGLGDLCGMKAVVDHFGAAPSGYVVVEGMALGHIYNRALGVQRFRITCRCQGGHSWTNFGRPSAVHELARLVTRLEQIHCPSTPRSSFNVGVFNGGTTVNTIGAEAHLELDLRSESEQVLAAMAKQAQELAHSCTRSGDDYVRFEVETIGQRPAGALVDEHPLLKTARQSLQAQGYEPIMTIGSTDANIPLSRGLPALTVGLTHGEGAHTIHEFIETAPLTKGLAQLVDLVRQSFYTA